MKKIVWALALLGIFALSTVPASALAENEPPIWGPTPIVPTTPAPGTGTPPATTEPAPTTPTGDGN